MFFIPAFVSKALDDKGDELGSNNKSESVWEHNGWKQTVNSRSKEQKLSNQMIKSVCIKLKVDRLGNIKPE